MMQKRAALEHQLVSLTSQYEALLNVGTVYRRISSVRLIMESWSSIILISIVENLKQLWLMPLLG